MKDIKERTKEYLNEKWKKEVDIKSTGEYEDKSVEELIDMLVDLKGKEPFNREKFSEVMFAVRAKLGWPGPGAVKKRMKEED
jgi:hypothetical protein